MIEYVLWATFMVVTGSIAFLLARYRANELNKKPNPLIDKLYKTFDVISVGGYHAHVNGLLFDNVDEFIRYATLEGQDRVFAWDETSHVFFFYYKKDWLVYIELPKRV